MACCLLALTTAAEVKQEAGSDVDVSTDQDVAEWHRRGYYGGYGGYWRGRRSVEEMKPEESDVEVSADQEAKELYGRRYHGYHGYPYGYNGHYGHWRGRR
jgi:hypothetical protein